MEQRGNSLSPFYQYAINHAGVGIHAIDRNGRTIIYNEKMKEIEGLALEDVGDRSILELFNFEQEESTLLQVLQSGKEQLNVKQTYWNRSGMEITTVNNTYPVLEDGVLVGAIEISRDVTAIEKFILHPLRKDSSPVTFNQIVAHSEAMKSVVAAARNASKAQLPVLLIGETGTGKDLLAESIHNELSPAGRPFYTLFCQSANEELIQKLGTELKGIDTFTLFCERIDLLPLPLQQSLFNLLKPSIKDGRQFIASIGDDPVELVNQGILMKDLYYFFASFTIRIPPLRKRKEDIGPFIDSYFQKRKERFGHSLDGVDEKVSRLFTRYDWPGNLRELEFLLDETSSLATTEAEITYEMLPLHFRIKTEDMLNKPVQAADFIVQSNKDLMPLDQFLREAEEYYLQKAMDLHEGNITKTANALGMSRQNLQYRLRKMKK